MCVSVQVSGGVIPTAARGTIRNGYIHVADWYGTVALLAGVSPRDPVGVARGMPDTDSIDMWAYLTGAIATSPRTEILLASSYADKARGGAGKNGSAALIVGDMKLVRFSQQYCFWTAPLYPNASTTHAHEEACDCGAAGCLFNITADPTEHHDLAQELPDVAQQLRARAEALDFTSIEYIKVRHASIENDTIGPYTNPHLRKAL